ncbi:flagellar hook-length control protein FliK [Dyella dinghuensis]|nr:flagellar hook-length control protein FliK [Dyella dinghuensis]
MSATPLPIQPATPQINAPSPSPQRNSQRDNDASFDARLNDAQRQRASSDDDSSAAKTADSAHDTSSGQSRQSSQANASANGKSAASAASDTSSSSSDDDSNTSGVASLANSVLSLIDQATGDTAGESTGAAGTKSAAGKSAVPSNNNGQLPHTPPQTAAVAPLPPPPVPQPAAATKGNATPANASATNSVGAATSPTALQSALGTTTGGSTDADDDDAGDTDTASTGSFGNAVVQAVADSVQTLAATAMTAGHAALGAVNAAPSTNTTANTPDLASLRGAFDATAVATQPASSTSTTHSLSNSAPVGSSGFAKELGHQVTWLSGQEVKQAQIRLNPENLGPLNVKVSVEHGRVDVAFTTQHPATTAAVQQGLDQLNQMLSGQGLSLGHTTVGQHGQQQQFDGSQQQGSSQTSGSAGDANDDTATSVLQRVAVGLVDAFA